MSVPLTLAESMTDKVSPPVARREDPASDSPADSTREKGTDDRRRGRATLTEGCPQRREGLNGGGSTRQRRSAAGAGIQGNRGHVRTTSREGMDESVKPRYEVRIWPEDGWWLARVMAAGDGADPSPLNALTQARSVAKIESMGRDLIATVLDAD